MKKIVIAPDSFKGSMSSKHVTAVIEREISFFDPEIETICVPMADGGEGTAETIAETLNGTWIEKDVHDPLGRIVRAGYAMCGKKAVIEMASASGLTLLSDNERNPLKTSTYGTGELLLDALDRGAERIILAVGGSSTNDGGLGVAAALGIRVTDEDGKELPPIGASLEKVKSIDISGLDRRIISRITVICDVDNPLLGAHGTAYTYAEQKGADQEIQDELENGMRNYVDVLEKTVGKVLRSLPGTGAAGGIVLPLISFMQAKLRPGIDVILDLLHFEDLIRDADLVITGEGKTDEQSRHGKVLSGIGKVCKKNGIPVVAVCGSMGDGAELIFTEGVDSLITTVNSIMTLDEAIRNADELLASAVRRMLRLIAVGERISNQKINL